MLRYHRLPPAGRVPHPLVRAIPLTAVALLVALCPARGAWSARLPTSARTAQPAPTFDLKGYVAELDRWSVVAARLRQYPQQAAGLKKDLPETWQVTVDGQRFSVSTEWLRDDLNSLGLNPSLAIPTSKRIERHIDTLRAEAVALDQESPSRSTIDPDGARRKLDEVLKRREFRGLRGPSWLDGLRQRLNMWLSDLISKLFSRLGGRPRASRGLMWVVAIALALGFMTWLLRSFLSRTTGTTLDPTGPPRGARGSADWARESLEASRRGDYRNAVRLAYWAGVYRLAELGFWHVDRTRTHREYLRLLPQAADGSARSSALTEVTYRFERIWYGRQPASAEDFQFLMTQWEMLGCEFPSTLATGNY